jgi:hypothetical protein
MEILRAIVERRDAAGNYSVISVLMAAMWDVVICFISFIEAFRN